MAIRKQFISFAAIFYCLMLSSVARAESQVFQEPSGGFINPAILYWSDNTDYTTRRARSYLLGSVSAGYRSKGLMVGATYDSSTEKWVDSGGAVEGDYIWTRTSWGPMVALAVNNFYIQLAYYYFSELKDKRPGASEITYKTGIGIQATFGYQFEVTSTFFIAPQLSYRSFRYTKSVQDGREASLTRDYIKTVYDPFLSLFFYF
jgi:hypothetical protein